MSIRNKIRWLFILPLQVVTVFAGQFTLTRQEGRVEILLDSKPFSSFHFDSGWPKPFLHPLRSPSGVVVTRGYPLVRVRGESDDHDWHRGLWYAHGAIQGVDFWREGSGSGFPLPLGKIAFRSLDVMEGGERARLQATFDLVAAGNQVLGTLIESFQFETSSLYNIIDMEITILANRGQCLKMGDTEEGSLAIRVAGNLRQDRGATLLNAQGQVGTENIWGKSSSWVDYSGTIGGAPVGIAVFDHPGNPKHPTHWHARGYGLLAANPFGEHDFYGDPHRDGGITIGHDDALTFHYRVVIHEGDAETAGVARLYQEYVSPDRE